LVTRRGFLGILGRGVLRPAFGLPGKGLPKPDVLLPQSIALVAVLQTLDEQPAKFSKRVLLAKACQALDELNEGTLRGNG
jgi:hypothetical protein